MSSVGILRRLPAERMPEPAALTPAARRAEISSELLARQLRSLEAQLAARTRELAERSTELAAIEEQKARVEVELQRHSRALQDYEKIVANRDAYIAHLEQDKVNLFSYKDVLEATNKELREARSVHVAELANTVSRREALVARLELEIDRLCNRSAPASAGRTDPGGANRNDLMLAGLCKSMKGIEIGPFYSPLVPKSEGWETTVVDFTDGAALRELARTHNSEAIRARASAIEDVDIVWRGEPLSELCLPLSPTGYDFILASHVIEHLPDLIGFFRDASRLLRPDGVVSLAVPDRRRCFDVFKTPSNTTQVLAAHRLGLRRHSPETMWEAWACSAGSAGRGSWCKGDEREVVLNDDLESCYERYQAYLAEEGRPDAPYVDAHAWRFTPASFELTMLELSALGLVDFVIHRLNPTHGAEFIVQMRRGRVDLTPGALRMKRTRLAHECRIELLTEMAAYED